MSYAERPPLLYLGSVTNATSVTPATLMTSVTPATPMTSVTPATPMTSVTFLLVFLEVEQENAPRAQQQAAEACAGEAQVLRLAVGQGAAPHALWHAVGEA